MKRVITFIERSDKGKYSAYIKDPGALNYRIHGTGSTAKEAIKFV